jgi:hypothetical protein
MQVHTVMNEFQHLCGASSTICSAGSAVAVDVTVCLQLLQLASHGGPDSTWLGHDCGKQALE